MLSIILLSHSVNKSPSCLSPSHVLLFLHMECFYSFLLMLIMCLFSPFNDWLFPFNAASLKGAVLYIGINRLNWLLVLKKLQLCLCSCLVLYALTNFPVRRFSYASINQLSAWQKTPQQKSRYFSPALISWICLWKGTASGRDSGREGKRSCGRGIRKG